MEQGNLNRAYPDGAESQLSDLRYVLDIRELSKSFKRHTIGKGGYTTLKSSLLKALFSREPAKAQFTTAIENLTLRIPAGTSVGIIGRNGSGKSTLLKLITGIYKPDRGKVSVSGRISALIELGAGFHPDFSGRENVYLGGVMHGMSKAEIDAVFDDIVEFAELRDVIDDPVRTYSSGMFMRLGFSLAIHTNPDILIVDEVLAVGDAGFVAKCKDRISELHKEGKTLILVSHDLDAVERWCDEAIWLHRGEVLDRGHPRRVIDHYREFLEKGEEAGLIKEAHDAAPAPEVSAPDPVAKGRWGSREAEITEVRLLNREGREQLLFHPEDAAIIEFDYVLRESVQDLVFGIAINKSDGTLLHGTNTDIERLKPEIGRSGTARYTIERLALLDGTYYLDVAAHRSDGYPYDYQKGALKFAMRSQLKHVGLYVPKHAWEFETGERQK